MVPGAVAKQELHLAGQQVRHRRPLPAIRHVQHVDAGHHLEQLARHVRRAAVAGGGHGDLAGIDPGIGDQVGHAVRRQRGMHHDDHGHADDAADGRDVADEVEVEFWIERGVDRIRYGRKQQRVAVGGRIDHGLGADIAAGAGTVLGDEGLAKPVREPLPDQPRRDVDAAARGKARDDAHRPRRIVERERGVRQGRQSGTKARQLQEAAARRLRRSSSGHDRRLHRHGLEPTASPRCCQSARRRALTGLAPGLLLAS